MNETLCIRLPLLRGPLPGPPSAPESRGGPAWPGALRPLARFAGLPGQGLAIALRIILLRPVRLRPCLSDLRLLSQTALSGLSVGATAAGNAVAARQAAEMALLKNLDGLSPMEEQKAKRAEAARRVRLEREQAQKALLWFWLQEEYLAELARADPSLR